MNEEIFYFERGEDVSPVALRDAFLEAKREGQAQARGARAAIASRLDQLAAQKAPLDTALAAGFLSDVEYANELVTLA